MTIVADYNGKNIKYYRNASLFYTDSTPTAMLFPDRVSTKNIGIYQTSTNYAFNSFMSDYRIYGRALSVSEISQIYNQTKGKY